MVIWEDKRHILMKCNVNEDKMLHFVRQWPKKMPLRACAASLDRLGEWS